MAICESAETIIIFWNQNKYDLTYAVLTNILTCSAPNL